MTDTDDDFDWGAEDDAKSAHVLYRAFLKLPKILRVQLVARASSSRPAFEFPDQDASGMSGPSRLPSLGPRVYIVVDAIPHFILVLLRISSYKVERLRVPIEVSLSTVEAFQRLLGWLAQRWSIAILFGVTQ